MLHIMWFSLTGLAFVQRKMKMIQIRGMVSFELGKEIEKDVFSACHERGTKKKFRVPIRN